MGKDRGKANKVGVCYRPLNQDEEADEAFNKQLAEVIQLSSFSWEASTSLIDKGNTIKCRRSSLGGF